MESLKKLWCRFRALSSPAEKDDAEESQCYTESSLKIKKSITCGVSKAKSNNIPSSTLELTAVTTTLGRENVTVKTSLTSCWVIAYMDIKSMDVVRDRNGLYCLILSTSFVKSNYLLFHSGDRAMLEALSYTLQLKIDINTCSAIISKEAAVEDFLTESLEQMNHCLRTWSSGRLLEVEDTQPLLVECLSDWLEKRKSYAAMEWSSAEMEMMATLVPDVTAPSKQIYEFLFGLAENWSGEDDVMSLLRDFFINAVCNTKDIAEVEGLGNAIAYLLYVFTNTDGGLDYHQDLVESALKRTSINGEKQAATNLAHVCFNGLLALYEPRDANVHSDKRELIGKTSRYTPDSNAFELEKTPGSGVQSEASLQAGGNSFDFEDILINHERGMPAGEKRRDYLTAFYFHTLRHLQQASGEAVSAGHFFAHFPYYESATQNEVFERSLAKFSEVAPYDA